MNVKNLKTPSISKGRKLLASVPFMIVAGVLINTWQKFYNDEYNPSLLHYVTLMLAFINGVLYLIRFKLGLLMTGAVLVLASFSFLCLFVYRSSFMSIFGITIPFEGWSFLVFIFYFATNFDILVNWYLDAKGTKPIE